MKLSLMQLSLKLVGNTNKSGKFGEHGLDLYSVLRENDAKTIVKVLNFLNNFVSLPYS